MYTGFYLSLPHGNNAFSFSERTQLSEKPPQIWVPPIIEASLHDAKTGDHIGFEEIDENGKLKSCRGLANFIRFSFQNSEGREIPGALFDNHNHAFYFWHEALSKNILQKNSHLIHIDAHTDLNTPSEFLSPHNAQNLEKVFDYTNHTLNVGNFITPAIHTGCISPDIDMLTTSSALLSFIPEKKETTTIVDIDLDFWNPELIDLPYQKSIEATGRILRYADFVTIATSPFFIDQKRAFTVLHDIFDSL